MADVPAWLSAHTLQQLLPLCQSCTGPLCLSLWSFLLHCFETQAAISAPGAAQLEYSDPRQCATATAGCAGDYFTTPASSSKAPRVREVLQTSMQKEEKGKKWGEKGKPFTGHWIRAVTWPWLHLATNSINYKQLPFSSSCQK